MRLETDGLVLRTTDIGESDRVITILTREYGIVRAFANGTKKLKNANSTATQLLCYSDFSLYSSKDSFIVESAVCRETFFRLREDIEKLSLAQFICELADETAPEMSSADSFLRTALNSLHMLVTGKRPPLFVKAVCSMRLVSLAGYMPAVSECAVCGKTPEGEIRFDCDEGVVYCSGCSQKGLPVSAGVLSAIWHICNAPDEKLFSFRMPESSLKALDSAVEKFTIAQTGRNYKTLDFYNGLYSF